MKNVILNQEINEKCDFEPEETFDFETFDFETFE